MLVCQFDNIAGIVLYISKSGTKAISYLSNTVPTVYWSHKQSHISVTSVCLGPTRTMILMRWLNLLLLISAWLFSYLCKLAPLVVCSIIIVIIIIIIIIVIIIFITYIYIPGGTFSLWNWRKLLSLIYTDHWSLPSWIWTNKVVAWQLLYCQLLSCSSLKYNRPHPRRPDTTTSLTLISYTW